MKTFFSAAGVVGISFMLFRLNEQGVELLMAFLKAPFEDDETDHQQTEDGQTNDDEIEREKIQ